MDDLVGRKIGIYRLISLIGAGSFARVYLAEHEKTKKHVAVKVLAGHLQNREDFTSFINESRTFRLRHPHIVQTLDFGINNDLDLLYIVMEYAPHGNLRQHHPQGIRVAVGAVIEYVEQIASALDYAHQQGIVHCDVKPENMLIAQDGRILLSDFGIALSSWEFSLDRSEGSAAGTLRYMAPEQLLGKPVAASDQYALGVATYEWLSGSYPFGNNHATSPSSLRGKAPHISSAIETIVMTALARNPTNRFPGVAKFAQMLKQTHAYEIVQESLLVTNSGHLKQGTSMPLDSDPHLPEALAEPVHVDAPTDIHHLPTLPPSSSVFPSPDNERTIAVSAESMGREVAEQHASVAQDKTNCPSCGAIIEKEDHFCDRCGYSLFSPEPVYRCPECHAEYPAPFEQCRTCGYPRRPQQASARPPVADEQLEMQHCPHCKASIQLAEVWCPVCGYYLAPPVKPEKLTPTQASLSAQRQIQSSTADRTYRQYIEEGNTHYAAKRYNDCIKVYRYCLQQKPTDGYVHAKIGDALRKLRRYKEALSAYEEALQHSDEAIIWAARGEVLYQLRRFDDSLQACTTSAAKEPGNGKVWFLIGQVSRHLGRYDQALDAYNHALAVAPNDPDILLARGLTLFNLEQFDDALESCQQALSIAPKKVKILDTIGRILYKIERFDDALDIYHRAYALSPRNDQIRTTYERLVDIKRHMEQLARNQATQQLVSVPVSSDLLLTASPASSTKSTYTDAARVQTAHAQAPAYASHSQIAQFEATVRKTTYDVVLSHAESDTAWVETYLARRLVDEHNIAVWLDKWMLIPGESLVDARARSIVQSRCCAVCIGKDTPREWFKQEIERALNQRARNSAFRVFAVLLDGANLLDVDNFLELTTPVDFRGSDTEYAFHLLVCGVKGIPPGPGYMKSPTLQGLSSPSRTESQLSEIKRFREQRLIDDSVAIDFQKLVLRDWLGNMYDTKDEKHE